MSQMTPSNTLDLLPRKHSLSSPMNHRRIAQFLLYEKSHIITIHKKDKDKKDPNNYCPISLLSCLGKFLERVINRRLLSYLEEQKILSPTQTGYRKHRSTEDQLALVAQEIENAFQEKKKVVSVFFDLTKAFDKVWRGGLLLKILESGVSGRMYRWNQCFLHDRSARVKLDIWAKAWKFWKSPTGRSHLTDTLSLVHQQHLACASTTCLQHPTCRWSRCVECIWIHHILCLQNPGSCEQDTAVDKWLGSSDQWSEDTGHSFLPLHLQRKCRHKAWGQDTTPSRDSHLSRGKAWHPNLMKATHRGHGEEKKKASRSLLPEIVWNTLRCQLQDSKPVYMGAVQPSLEYRASAWATAAKTHTIKLDKVQNIVLRTILGAMKTTPIAEMEKNVGVKHLRAGDKPNFSSTQKKIKRMPDHPLQQKLKDPPPPPLPPPPPHPSNNNSKKTKKKKPDWKEKAWTT